MCDVSDVPQINVVRCLTNATILRSRGSSVIAAPPEVYQAQHDIMCSIPACCLLLAAADGRDRLLCTIYVSVCENKHTPSHLSRLPACLLCVFPLGGRDEAAAVCSVWDVRPSRGSIPM